MAKSANTKHAFESVCSLLNFSKENGLATEEKIVDDEHLRIVLSDTIKKLGVDAIFFLRPNEGGPSSPVIYFKLMDYYAREKIAELHKLSWNMGQAPLLFIVLPDAVQIYNNLVPPSLTDEKAGFIEELKIFSQTRAEKEKLRNYERAEIESGNYWLKNVKKFKTDNNVFNSLLKNLDFMRRTLINSELPPNIVHALLLRSIFIKYLEDRRDSKDLSMFPSDFFSQFYAGACSFTDLLKSKEATFNFFKYLSSRFNGDILTWEQNEDKIITQEHLNLLRRLLLGEEYLENRQMTLWQLYSFDVIPIELISSMYEQFLRGISEKKRVSPKGIHYTPYNLVAFLTGEVLSGSTITENMKIIDPACGSGIFLVEAYRRLVNHWITSNNFKRPSPLDLTRILNENIYGVDTDEKAIGIAALSLYLALCDYLEPKTIWNEVTFERLIGNRLFVADFFDDRQKFALERFDLIIGNPPWESDLSPFAEFYVRHSFKHIGDRQICQAFLWKSADLCKKGGQVCMIMSSKALLFNRSGENSKFRNSFFRNQTVKCIFNFSALRRSLFAHAVGPGACVIFSPNLPADDETIMYYSPKPSFTLQDELSFIIEPQDVARIPLKEALDFELIWKVAMWGTPRDYDLIKKLSSHPELVDIAERYRWIHGEGFIVGNGKYNTKELIGIPELSVRDLQKYVINKKALKPCCKERFIRPRTEKKQIYRGPHVLIKQSPSKAGFISAVMTEDSVFPQSIVGIHGEEKCLSALIRVVKQ